MLVTRERLPDGFHAELQLPLTRDVLSAWNGYLGLVRWVEAIAGVESVRHDLQHEALVVRYDERRVASEVLRGTLLDRVTAGTPQRIVERARVSIAHELPGRLRLRVHGGSPRVVEQFATLIDQLDGVERARAQPANRSIVVFFDPETIDAEQIVARANAVDSADLPAPPPPAPDPRVEWLKTGFSTAALIAAVTGLAPAPVVFGSIALTAIPPFRRAFQSLGRREINVDVMDATAIAVCFVRGEPITAGIITALLAIGDLILERTQARAHVAISQLMHLDDGVAFVSDPSGAIRRVHPRELAPGMRIVIYPGTRVPADGVIIEGDLAVDEKALTGESLPRDRTIGQRVMAASVAIHGQAIVLVERAGGDTVAGRIVRILEGAGTKPMTLQRNAQRVADKLVIPTFATAGLAYAMSGVFDRMTSVLITDFGTGVRVAVPTAALTAMTLAARHGVLVKGATFLERLAEADTIVFDKTGTLTLGVPEVTTVVPTTDRFTVAEVVAYAAAAEGNQHHPIADAIRRDAIRREVPKWDPEPSSETYRIGLGLVARVNGRAIHLGNPRLMREAGIDPTPAEHARGALASRGISSVVLSIDGDVVGVIGYADAPRPESARVVEALKAGGRRRVLLLSGDARAPVEAIAALVGIDEAIAEVLPQDKVDVVRRLKAAGRKVAMVGDGINDAPALAVADIGISLHGGTEVALETADVVLLEGGLERLPAVFAVADSAMRRVKEVLGLVLVPNMIAIAAGALGFITPITAAIVNNGSTIAAATHAVWPLLRKRRE
jgi:heavy metal translocating P-type ATPase